MLAASRSSDESAAALETLCAVYWGPVYAFIRRSGHDAEAARDLTQAFFVRVLERDFFGQARPERGRFRSFLLASVKNFLTNEWQRATSAKRGGQQPPLTLDVEGAERTYHLAAAEGETPDRVYERRWALAVLGRALGRVEERYRDAGREELFRQLRPYLTGDEPPSYESLSAGLQMTTGAVRVAVHRARRHFAAALREIVADTVAEPGEVDEELQYMLGVVSG